MPIYNINISKIYRRKQERVSVIDMARAKTDKKLVSFVKAGLINKLVKDKAEIENRSESAIMEEILLDAMLPEEKEARFVAENYLYGENGNIGRALEALFANNSAGVGKAWSSKYDNFEELMKFAKTESSLYNQTILTGEERELPHMKSQFRAVIDALKNESEKEFAQTLLEELETEPQFSRFGNIYQILANNWEDLKGWSITYRLLADLVSLETSWRDTADARAELLEIIKRTSSEWK